MNTKLLTLVAILFSVMMLSCHDASEIKLTYRIELSQELEDVSDVKIVYTDFDGKEYRETMESGRWETSMTTPVPPVASMIRVEASRNANKVEDKEIVLEMDFSCVAERYINHYGADRFVYGSDFPMWDPVKEMERFMKLKLTDDQKEQIAHITAEGILGYKQE